MGTRSPLQPKTLLVCFGFQSKRPNFGHLYRDYNLIVQADVQQLKNPINVDVRRDAAIKFKLGDPIIVRMVRQIVWESVTVNNDHHPRARYRRVVLVHYANI